MVKKVKRYKLNSHRDVMNCMMTIVNDTRLHI